MLYVSLVVTINKEKYNELTLNSFFYIFFMTDWLNIHSYINEASINNNNKNTEKKLNLI